jgi:hypothetical protein
MRSPLLKPEAVSETQRWLFISEPPPALITSSKSSSGSKHHSLPSTKTSSLRPPSSPSIKKPPSNRPNVSITASVPPSSSSQAPHTKDDNISQEEHDNPLDPESAVSYRVFEWIIQKTESQIKSYQNQHMVPDSLRERLKSAQIALTLLTTQIQAGLMNIEHYTQLLHNRLEKDRSLVARFEREDKRTLATLFKEKIKLIEEELQQGDEGGGG